MCHLADIIADFNSQSFSWMKGLSDGGKPFLGFQGTRGLSGDTVLANILLVGSEISDRSDIPPCCRQARNPFSIPAVAKKPFLFAEEYCIAHWYGDATGSGAICG